MTSSDRPGYRRLLLGLQPGRFDPVTFRGAAQLARGLDVPMFAVLVEDPSIAVAAALPFARELRLPTHDWQPADPERLALELRMSSDQARRDLLRESEALGIDCRFEVARGDPATAVVGLCGFHDIVALVEPAASFEFMSGVVRRMREAALASEATVLFLPSRPGTPDGAVVTLVGDQADAALEVAAAMAVRSKRRLLVLAERGTIQMHAALMQVGRAAGLAADAVEVVGLASSTPEALAHALAGRHAYCLVKTRGVGDLSPAGVERFSSRLGAPVLLVEPPHVSPRS